MTGNPESETPARMREEIFRDLLIQIVAAKRTCEEILARSFVGHGLRSKLHLLSAEIESLEEVLRRIG